MILNEVYYDLATYGFTRSHVHFSKRWLGKSSRYMSMLRASGREPSLDTLARFVSNIKMYHDTCKRSHLDKIRQKASWLYPILVKMNKALYQKAIKENPAFRAYNE